MGLCASNQKRSNRLPNSLKIKRRNQSKTTDCLNQADLRTLVNQIFNSYDKNKNGVLEEEEVKEMLKRLAQKRGKILSEELLDKCTQTMMAKADLSSDGVISRKQFYYYYKSQ